MITDNSEGGPVIVAEKLPGEEVSVSNRGLFQNCMRNMKAESRLERGNVVLLGFEKSYRKMLEFKKLKKSEVVILRMENC